MASPSFDRTKAKNHRTVARAIAFLLICSGISMVLYTSPPLLQFTVAMKAMAAAEAKTASTGKF